MNLLYNMWIVQGMIASKMPGLGGWRSTVSVLANLVIRRLLNPTGFPFHLNLPLCAAELSLLRRDDLHGFLGHLHLLTAGLLGYRHKVGCSDHLWLVDLWLVLVADFDWAAAQSDTLATCCALGITCLHYEARRHGVAIIEMWWQVLLGWLVYKYVLLAFVTAIAQIWHYKHLTLGIGTNLW